MSRFVNPFTDIGFKVIFGQPASKDLLIILLNELLAGEHHVTDLTFLDKEDHADNVSDKYGDFRPRYRKNRQYPFQTNLSAISLFH